MSLPKENPPRGGGGGENQNRVPSTENMMSQCMDPSSLHYFHFMSQCVQSHSLSLDPDWQSSSAPASRDKGVLGHSTPHVSPSPAAHHPSSWPGPEPDHLGINNELIRAPRNHRLNGQTGEGGVGVGLG